MSPPACCRWDEDEIGDLLSPAAVDWAKWSTGHLSLPLAPPLGRSRLQRERMDKKMRKGTLRAAA
jgi:hypothetical protein